jgi:biotin carboxyl carrier protein
MEAVAKINAELLRIRKELEPFDAVKQFPEPFNPLTDKLPAGIDREFDKAIEAAQKNNEKALLQSCHAIEAYFNFPKPNELVKKAEVPGGMYTNMVAQLKQMDSMYIIEDAMKLIPAVRLAAGLPPLVTPTSQIVGAQAVNCALDLKNGKPLYTDVSNQFVALVKGEYGKTPIPVDPEFRLKIAGTREEIPYDTSKYAMQDNPVLTELGGVKLAENEKETLLLELFPSVARTFLSKQKEARYQAEQAGHAQEVVETVKAEPVTGHVVKTSIPGTLSEILVQKGDAIEKGQKIAVIDFMGTMNDIISNYAGTVKRFFAEEGSLIPAKTMLIELEN